MDFSDSFKDYLEALKKEYEAPIENRKGFAETFFAPSYENSLEDFVIFYEDQIPKALYLSTNSELSKETFTQENWENYGKPSQLVEKFYKELNKQISSGDKIINIEEEIKRPIDFKRSFGYFARIFDGKTKNQKAYNLRGI